MTDEDAKIAEVLKRSADAHLPDDFADRLVERIRKDMTQGGNGQVRAMFARLVLVAASVTFLLGFAPHVLERHSDVKTVVAHIEEIRATDHTLPQDSQLNALALLGFCREVIRRRVKPLVERLRKRRDDE